MAAKKKTGGTKKARRKKLAKKSPARKTERPREEFIVVRVADVSKTGGTLRVVNVAGSLAGAKKVADKLTGTGIFAILEKKGLFERKPAIETHFIDGNIAKA